MATEVAGAKTLAMEMMEAVAVTEEVSEVRDQTNLPPVGGHLATRRRASLYISGVWIRQPKELYMKGLLGLLLVTGMVGCGAAEKTPPGVLLLTTTALPAPTDGDPAGSETVSVDGESQTPTVTSADGPFTLVIIPDTQIYAYNDPTWRRSSRAEVFLQMTRWITTNAHSHNIRFALHMGDIVTTHNRASEWAVANRAMSQLDGVVPYCFTVGNHDLAMGGANVRDSTFFNKTFSYRRYERQPWYGGRLADDGFLPKNNYDNSYHFFTGAGHKFLIVSLEVGPTDRMLAWADEVIGNHPEHRVIVITHSYMDGHDVRDPPNGYGYLPPGEANTGEEIWQKLIRKHKSVFFVLNGHLSNKEGHRGFLASRGEHGNTVYQLLSGEDYDGWLRLLRFTPDKDQIEVKSFSPWKPQDPSHQFQQYGFPLPGYRVDAAHQYILPYVH